MKNLAFHSLLRLKDDSCTSSHYLTYTFLLKRLGECTFWTWEWRGEFSLCWGRFSTDQLKPLFLLLSRQVPSDSPVTQEDDDIASLLSVIAAEKPAPSHTIKPRPPRPNRRDTDTVLTSLLSSLQPPPSPPDSIPSVDPREIDSQGGTESAYDSDQVSELAPRRALLSDRTETEASSDYLSSEPEARRGSTSSSSEVSGYSDWDVFDMLRDNSQTVAEMLKDDKAAAGLHDDINGNSKVITRDLPPPVPTTPIPSDDEGTPFKLSLREMSTRNFSDDSGMSAEEAPPPLPAKVGSDKPQSRWDLCVRAFAIPWPILVNWPFGEHAP